MWSEPKENFKELLIIFQHIKSIVTIQISALNYLFCDHKRRIYILKSDRYLQRGFRIGLRVFLTRSVSPVRCSWEPCIV